MSVLRHITVLNVLLFIVAGVLAYYILNPFTDSSASFKIPSPKKSMGEEKEKEAEKQIPPASDFLIIADQNPFYSERKIPPEKKDEKPLPKAEFVLYGTLLSDEASLAFIEDMKSPQTSAGRGKRQLPLRKGGILSGYTLSELYHDRVIMVRGEERVEVKVATIKPKGKDTAATLPTQPQKQTVARPESGTRRSASSTSAAENRSETQRKKSETNAKKREQVPIQLEGD